MSQQQHHVGQRISFDGALCTVRYIGPVAGTTGSWLGVEWDDPARGKHDGSHKNVRYFTCLSKAHTAASFVRPTRPADKPQSFIAALKDKYTSESGGRRSAAASQVVVISGKVAEEVGFDKIRRQQAQLQDIKFAILDEQCVVSARDEGEPGIRETCPSVTQLDLSRSLFEGLGPIVEVCRELPKLKSLNINGCRFTDVLGDDALRDPETPQAFPGVKELGLGDTLLGWDEICHIAGRFTSLGSLSAGANQLTSLAPVDYGTLSQTLTSLTLEYNEISTMADLAGLTGLTALRNLHLKGNNISALAIPGGPAVPVFSSSLQYLDLSSNDIKEWSFVDQLPHHFPGLTGLRISRNPIYDALGGTEAGTGAGAGAGANNPTASLSSEESHMYTVARLGQLRSLNFTHITASDRNNAEMFYLSRIARQLASVPESAEDEVKQQHPRYAELCQLYGEPEVVRRVDVNPAFLEARLINVRFRLGGGDGGVGEEREKMARVPRSTDIYAVKGIAGRLFEMQPLKLSLIWETGEWDPVAGFYDKDGDSSDDEEEDEDEEYTEEQDKGNNEKAGRWVKREVLLKDGPRQLGYCVDGRDVTIRIEGLRT